MSVAQLFATWNISMFLQAPVPGVSEHRIANIFKPMATPASAERSAGVLTILITSAIFVVVAGLIVFTIARFRRRGADEDHQEPAQVYGSNQIEVAWTVIPILIVFVLIGVSARVIAAVENASPPPAALHVTLIGHQWWWEVVYPDYHVVTANEIHVPATADGKNATYLTLQSQDVIHSFWVPQLAGKTDLIPNRNNYMWIDPREPGVFVGNCAEYCGTQHANMLLRVVAQTPEGFKPGSKRNSSPRTRLKLPRVPSKPLSRWRVSAVTRARNRGGGQVRSGSDTPDEQADDRGGCD